MQKQVEFRNHEPEASKRDGCANPCQKGAIGGELLAYINWRPFVWEPPIVF